MEIKNQRHTFAILDINVAALPEMIPTKDMTFEQLIEVGGSFYFFTRLKASFGYSVVP
jgi:hypothetical protein